MSNELMKSVRPLRNSWNRSFGIGPSALEESFSGRTDFMSSFASVIELVIIGFASSIRIDMLFRLGTEKAVKAFTTRNLQHTGRAFCLTLSYVETERDRGDEV